MHESCPDAKLIHAIKVTDADGSDVVSCCSICLKTETSGTLVDELFRTYRARGAKHLEWHPEFVAHSKKHPAAKTMINDTKSLVIKIDSRGKSSQARSTSRIAASA